MSTAGKSNMGLETVISTVFWKHHSCLGNATVVTKWYGSKMSVMTFVCPLTLWNFEKKLEPMRLEVGIISAMQVLKWFHPLWWKTFWVAAVGGGPTLPRQPDARYFGVQSRLQQEIECNSDGSKEEALIKELYGQMYGQNSVINRVIEVPKADNSRNLIIPLTSKRKGSKKCVLSYYSES